MSKSVFPSYNVSHLEKVLFVTLNEASALLNDISLESCTITSGKKFIDEEKIDFNIVFGKTDLKMNGDIINFKYLRDEKKYQYIINLNFTDIIIFKKWLAIIKGIHNARFPKQ